MEQFTRRDRAYIIRVDSDQRHSVSAAIYKLDFIGPAAFIDMHNRSNVTTIEPFVGRFAIEHDERMFSNHGPSSGYAVTSRGGRSPSTIHTANTLAERWDPRPIRPTEMDPNCWTVGSLA